MQKKSKKQYGLAAMVILLMLLSFTTGIFASRVLLKIDNTIPVAVVDIDTGGEGLTEEAALSGEAGHTGDDGSESTSSDTQQSSQEADSDSAQKPYSAEGNTTYSSGKFGAEVRDENGVWGKGTSITLFKASYENENGEVTVQSANGDAVIAPGTSNKYEFRLNNTGTTGITYELESASQLSFTVNGEPTDVPMKVRMYTADGKYLVGTENSFADMAALDGVKDSGELSAGNYTKYIVEWQWPYEGNNELDTLIGNMSVEGDELSVGVGFSIIATGDGSATGGLPQTGDYSGVGFWMLICSSSFVLLILLLFGYKRKEDEEETV